MAGLSPEAAKSHVMAYKIKQVAKGSLGGLAPGRWPDGDYFEDTCQTAHPKALTSK